MIEVSQYAPGRLAKESGDDGVLRCALGTRWNGVIDRGRRYHFGRGGSPEVVFEAAAAGSRSASRWKVVRTAG